MIQNTPKYEQQSDIQLLDIRRPQADACHAGSTLCENRKAHAARQRENGACVRSESEIPHTSKDTDHFFAPQPPMRNNSLLSCDVVVNDDIIDVESIMPCVDNSKRGEESSEDGESEQTEKTLTFREKIRNTFARIFEDLSGLINGREKGECTLPQKIRFCHKFSARAWRNKCDPGQVF